MILPCLEARGDSFLTDVVINLLLIIHREIGINRRCADDKSSGKLMVIIKYKINDCQLFRPLAIFTHPLHAEYIKRSLRRPRLLGQKH